MIKKIRNSYSGINQDISPSKLEKGLYHEAYNMKLTPVEGASFGALSNVIGNKLSNNIPSPVIQKTVNTIEVNGKTELYYNSQEVEDLPAISGVQKYIGHTESKNGIVIFSTDDNGFDCIWELVDVQDAPTLKLKYCRNLAFSSQFPIQAVYNYENDKTEKVYWADGNNMLRFINLGQSIANGYSLELIDLPASSVNSRSEFESVQPSVTEAGGGGTHTAGVVQYGYTMYNVSGSETSLSPLTDLFPIGKVGDNGGGEVNEIVNSMPIVTVSELDTKYNYIKLYRVKYTTYNGTPSITLIYDGGAGKGEFVFNDTGTSNLDTLSLSEFLFLGADPIKPKHITSKDSRLLAANIDSTSYQLDLDTRAYSYNLSSDPVAKIYNEVQFTGTGPIPYGSKDFIELRADYDSVPEDYDAVNLDFDTYRYMVDAEPDQENEILDDAICTVPKQENSGRLLLEGGSYSEIVDFTVTCTTVNPLNQYLVEVDMPASQITNQDNKLVIDERGEYNIAFTFDWDVLDITKEQFSANSWRAYVNVNRNGEDFLVEMSQSATTEAGIASVIQEFFGGDILTPQVYLSYNYNNQYCLAQAFNPELEGGGVLTIDQINQGAFPLEASSAIEILVSEIRVTNGSAITQETEISITEVNGENVVLDNTINFATAGSYNLIVNTALNVNDNIPDNPIFSLGVMANGLLISEYKLFNNRLGLINQSFDAPYLASTGDEIKLVLITNELNGINFDYSNYNIDFSAEVSLFLNKASGSSKEGGTGKYISYELTRTSAEDLDLSKQRFYKDNEIYRLGIRFRNSIGQTTEAKWVADFKAPQGNLEGQCNTLKVYLSDKFYDYIEGLPKELKPVSYEVLRAVRQETDKTIGAQGMLTGMMVQVATRKPKKYRNSPEERAEANPDLLKLPIFLTRGYGNGTGKGESYYPLLPTGHNREMGKATGFNPSNYFGTGERGYGSAYDQNVVKGEIYIDFDEDYNTQAAWQYTKMMQLHSPEAAFQMGMNLGEEDKLKIIGTRTRNLWEYKQQLTNVDTLLVEDVYSKSSVSADADFYKRLELYGIIGPAYRKWSNSDKPSKLSSQLSVHKTLNNFSRKESIYDIYGSAEVTETGQGPRFYNNNQDLRYANTLSTIISDIKEAKRDSQDDEPAVSEVISEGNRCVTLVLGDEEIDAEDRIGLEDIWTDLTGGNNWDVEMFAEIVKSNTFIYSGSLYGGYDFYSRANTDYTPIGGAFKIEDSGFLIKSPGDTFVQNFVYTRLARRPGSSYTKTSPLIVETLEFPVETTVNLTERNDTSIRPWGTILDPYSTETTKYNKVYSTNASIIVSKTDNELINAAQKAETQIISSKAKLSGEFVDSWLDFQANETMELDGTYGPITSLITTGDNVYSTQDRGVAMISVNPRVQVQGNDGVAIELGTGSVLNDFQYISTKSGAQSRGAVLELNGGFTFLDADRKKHYIFSNQLTPVSEVKGIHVLLRNLLDKTQQLGGNPLIGNGVAMGYDEVNADLFLTVTNEGQSFTIVYNNKTGSYTSFLSMVPSAYIIGQGKLFTTNANRDDLWEEYAGEYQTYFGTKYESSITIVVNGEDPSWEKTFNNIEFDSYVSLDDVDVADSTIDSVEAWNFYQKSGKIPLVLNSNIKRRLRTWRATLPREEGTRNRLKGKLIYLKLGFNPEDNKKLILQDIITNYTIR